MLYCLQGNLNISIRVWACLKLYVLLLITFQASSVSGQEPSVAEPSSSPAASAYPSGTASTLAFEVTLIEDAREGHASLKWNPLTDASEYRLSDANGRVMYLGAFPQAFVSGLEDGEHSFSVAAIHAGGQQIAISEQPAVVVVKHWPMAQALALFSVGAIVFVVLISLLLYGSLQARLVDRPPTTLSGESRE